MFDIALLTAGDTDTGNVARQPIPGVLDCTPDDPFLQAATGTGHGIATVVGAGHETVIAVGTAPGTDSRGRVARRSDALVEVNSDDHRRVEDESP